jgi:hypothetical protein
MAPQSDQPTLPALKLREIEAPQTVPLIEKDTLCVALDPVYSRLTAHVPDLPSAAHPIEPTIPPDHDVAPLWTFVSASRPNVMFGFPFSVNVVPCSPWPTQALCVWVMT